MRISLPFFRLAVLGAALISINAMSLVMILARFKMIGDSGMGMGIGFMSLFFLMIGAPILIMFTVLDPSWRWWIAMFPSLLAFVFLLFF